jgi:DnaJ-domain-containing protein 1
MSLDYRYLVIQFDKNENLSKVTEFTSLDNLIVIKVSLHKNNCIKDNYKNKELCFKFDDKHYLIDWNMDNIDINEVQSNLLDINFLNSDDKLEQHVTATNQNSDTDKLEQHVTATNQNSDTDKYYKALGLENTANSDEIKKAYHTLALQYHPDKGGDPVKFNEIQNAYNCLIKEDCS